MCVIFLGRNHMLEQELVTLAKSSLAKPAGARSPAEELSIDELCLLCEPIIRARIWRVHDARKDVDDLVQDVWLLVFRRLPKWEFDPALGTFHGWVASIASHEAWKHAHRRSRQHVLDTR